MKIMSKLVDAYLNQYRDRLETRACLIEAGAIATCYALLQQHLDAGHWLLVSDANTWQAAGAKTAAMLDAAGQSWARYDIPMPTSGDPVCSDALIAAFERAFVEAGASAAIALGSGTINDVVKMGASHQTRPMAVIATAPSMNGYNSGIAAILSEGVKTTQPCTAPRVVIADLEVLAKAPARMIASGLGDLLSKPVSNSDWRLSARLKGTAHSVEAMEIIEHGARALDGVAERLVARDIAAIGRSEEHTSELQSRPHLVCRLLLEKKKGIRLVALGWWHTPHRDGSPLAAGNAVARRVLRRHRLMSTP